jgi:hypothetical protein
MGVAVPVAWAAPRAGTGAGAGPAPGPINGIWSPHRRTSGRRRGEPAAAARPPGRRTAPPVRSTRGRACGTRPYRSVCRRQPRERLAHRRSSHSSSSEGSVLSCPRPVNDRGASSSSYRAGEDGQHGERRAAGLRGRRDPHDGLLPANASSRHGGQEPSASGGGSGRCPGGVHRLEPSEPHSPRAVKHPGQRVPTGPARRDRPRRRAGPRCWPPHPVQRISAHRWFLRVRGPGRSRLRRGPVAVAAGWPRLRRAGRSGRGAAPKACSRGFG